jgi:hypothetical protein
MEINPQWITLIFACNAMIASIAAAFVNTRAATTEFRANVLSVNRQKWIETMRDLVASLHSQLIAAAAVRQLVGEPTGVVIAQDRELLGRVEKLLRTMSMIELMLSPLERDHQTLNALMKEAADQLRSASPDRGIEDRIEGISHNMIRVTQGILKREWGRVKRGE